MFTEEFLDSLPTDPAEALLALCESFEEFNSNVPWQSRVDDYDAYLEAYAAFTAFIDGFGMEIAVPELGKEKTGNIDLITSFVREMRESIERSVSDKKFSLARSKFGARFGSVFIYEFSDGDLSRIQQLLNELRNEIERSELFDAKHKQRVLNKVESVQRELHKKITSLDKLWGLIGEAGVALGKFGINAKPFVDRVKEIAQITWRTQARAEELPSGTTLPLMTSSDVDHGDDA